MRLFYYLLLCLLPLLFLNACQEEQLLPEWEQASLESSPNSDYYIQVEGVIDWRISTDTLVLGGATVKELEDLVTVLWVNNQLIFCSNQLEFTLEGEVSGRNECEAYATKPSQLMQQDGANCLIFEPNELFWRCLDEDHCYPGEEVFSFQIFIKRLT